MEDEDQPQAQQATPEEVEQLRAISEKIGSVVDRAAADIATGLTALVMVGVNPVVIGTLTSSMNAYVHALLASYGEADDATAQRMLQMTLEAQTKVFNEGRKTVVPMTSAGRTVQ